MINRFKRYRYEIIAALSGAVVMILELVGARQMAPFFGTSTYVWTAMIGVILGALSLGYWYGGKLADRRADDRGLMRILMVAAVSVGVSMLIQPFVLSALANTGIDVRVSAVMSAIVLFAPASALLGVISPYVAKLRLSSLKTAGSSIGRLYAAGTVGSIAGTFLCGYWFISWLGNFTLGVSLVVVLVLVSFIAEHRSKPLLRIGIAVVGVIVLAMLQPRVSAVVADTDSSYARYQVSERQVNGQTVRYLLMDNLGAQSGAVVGRPYELVFEYTRAFKAAADAYGDFKDALVIGGGAYTFPSVLAKEHPRSHINVVEIDPALDRIAADYFGYVPQPNLSLIHEDGRVFLNQNRQQFQLVYIDAFSSLTPPYQLTTREATKHMQSALSDDGLLLINVIATPDVTDPYFAATYQTYRSVFPEVIVYQAQTALTDVRQNLLFVMGGKEALAKFDSFPYPRVFGTDNGLILTDDHAPVEQLIQASQR